MRDDLMFEPIRGGNRGGAGDFKWSDVSADKDREHYLGHSINAPTGRWQKNKDVHWYGRDSKDDAAQRDEEIRRVKEAEAAAMSAALGFAPEPTTTTTTASPPVEKPPENAESKEQRRLEREERRKRKEERRLRREERADRKLRRRADRSRSRSPRR